MDMEKSLLVGFAALTFCAASFAETPSNMQVWLKNGEQQVFNINEVDSVTFGAVQDVVYKPLSENTMPPTFSKPNPLTVSAQEQAFVQANNAFAMECYAKIRKLPVDPESTDPRAIHFFSPVSLNIALGFCANGASDKGAKEITDALGFQSKNALKDMNDFYQKVYLSLNSNVDSVDIHTANALWVQEGAPVYDNFLETARQKYYATVRHLNFMRNPQGAKDTIDHWAALMTNDRIKNLGIDIHSNVVLVLNNACYFNAKWKVAFQSAGQKDFFGTLGESQQTDFMGIAHPKLPYAETDDYQAIALDYFGGDSASIDANSTYAYSMVVVLPKEGKNIDEVLPAIQWESIPFQTQAGDLIMPKFEIKGNYQLVKTLEEFNIEDIFSTYPNAIMSGNGICPYYIAQVAQDYFIKVDEKGTEAAAVTSIVDEIKMISPDPEDRFKMNCNRPFAFAIRENATGLLLFLGEYDFVP